MIETALVTGPRPADTCHVAANQKPRSGDCTQRPSALNPFDQTYWTGIRFGWTVAATDLGFQAFSALSSTCWILEASHQ
jgi:hypothetical protein